MSLPAGGRRPRVPRRRSGAGRCASRDVAAHGALRRPERRGPGRARRPLPGQFYMLAAQERWGGGDGERPLLPRAFSVLRAHAGRRRCGSTSCSRRSAPGPRACASCGPGDGLLRPRPARASASRAPRRRAAGAMLVGGGVGIAPLAILPGRAARPRARRRRRCSASATRRTPPARRCCADAQRRDRRRQRRPPRARHRPARRRARRATPHAVVYACGPPAMLEAVRALCAARGVAGAAGAGVAGWPAATAPASAASSRCAAAATCGSASTGPVARAPTALETGAAAGARGRRDERAVTLLRARAGPSGRQRLGHLRRDRRPAGLRRRARSSASRSRRSSRRRSRSSRAHGNPPPRLCETAGGLINSIGLPNKGLRGLPRARTCPQLAGLPVPLITNVMGSTAAEVAALVEAVDAERDEVAAIELNVSCPNVKTGLIVGARPGRDCARCWTRSGR